MDNIEHFSNKVYQIELVQLEQCELKVRERDEHKSVFCPLWANQHYCATEHVRRTSQSGEVVKAENMSSIKRYHFILLKAFSQFSCHDQTILMRI